VARGWLSIRARELIRGQTGRSPFSADAFGCRLPQVRECSLRANLGGEILRSAQDFGCPLPLRSRPQGASS